MEGMMSANMPPACEKRCPTCCAPTLGPVVGNTRSCPHCKNTWQLEDLDPNAPGIRVHGERV